MPVRNRTALRQITSARNKKAPGLPALLTRLLDAFLRIISYCMASVPPPCRAICGLNGESPLCGSSTTTMVPTLTRL
jgi:hypothetical protein